MATTYIIQQHTGQQYEAVENGEYQTSEAAIAAMRELESELGWRDMRVVADSGERRNLSGRLLTGDDAHEVIEYGLDSDE